MEKKTGIELIAQERQEQIKKHGRTVERDFKENSAGDMINAAATLMNLEFYEFPHQWDEVICDKMMSKSYKDRLVIAGAFIAAEIDRLQAKEGK